MDQYYLTLQQLEYERIKQVQQQAALQQQRALFYQQMMYYQQELLDQQQQYCNTPLTASEPMMDDERAKKRAEHNAIERARRECLNSKFQQLAHSLPNLQDDKRPSKGTIIERTLKYVKETIEKEEQLQYEIEQLRQANEALITEMTTEILEDFDDNSFYNQDFSKAMFMNTVTSIPF